MHCPISNKWKTKNPFVTSQQKFSSALSIVNHHQQTWLSSLYHIVYMITTKQNYHQKWCHLWYLPPPYPWQLSLGNLQTSLGKPCAMPAYRFYGNNAMMAMTTVKSCDDNLIQDFKTSMTTIKPESKLSGTGTVPSRCWNNQNYHHHHQHHYHHHHHHYKQVPVMVDRGVAR